MTTSSTPPSSGDKEPRDASYWAQQFSTIRVKQVPAGAKDLNMEGHHLVGPLQGFGQIYVLMRANKPIYEAGFRLLVARGEDDLWKHTLSSLAAHFDVKAPVKMRQRLLDPKVQWSEAKNVWENAAIRTMLYWMVYPVIWMGKRLRG